MPSERRNKREQNKPCPDLNGIIGNSAQMCELKELILKYAAQDSTVLITGESGTGKEKVARAIHDYSKRRSLPFVAFNSTAIAKDVVESEIFGHVKGSFSGASSDRKGLLQEAGDGTIFFDEIGDITLELQTKLLRVFEEHEFKPLGSSKILKFTGRIAAATNRDLETMVKEGKFREDLYHRIKVLPIHTPTLRERPEDIPLLIRHFLSNTENAFQGYYPIDQSAIRLLSTYDWPGNVRQLKNVLQELVAKGGGGSAITAEQVRAILSELDANVMRPVLGEPIDLNDERLRRVGDDDTFETYLFGIKRRVIDEVFWTHPIREDAARRLGIPTRKFIGMMSWTRKHYPKKRHRGPAGLDIVLPDEVMVVAAYENLRAYLRRVARLLIVTALQILRSKGAVIDRLHVASRTMHAALMNCY